ncbi:MAG: hypothetical protein ACKVS9_09860 [Phycisphaerae bacterium]
MTSVKRLEIVITALALPELQRLLDTHEPVGYTVVRDVSGMDDGSSIGDEVSGALHNHLVIISVEPSRLKSLTDGISPLLKRFGASCLISDAQAL